MKVILRQEAEFNLDTENLTAIPMQTFLNMVGSKENNNEESHSLPVVSLFKSVEAFRAEYDKNGGKFSDMDVYVMGNGGICVFQRPFPAESGGPTSIDNKTETTDGSTSTEENQGE